jgi:hypothetical protein
MTLYIGIDPGQGGGIAIVTESGAVLRAVKMADTDRDVFDALSCLNSHRAFAVLEKVHSSPQMGVASAFTFGCSYGALRMALCAAGIPYDEVTPQAWQKVMGCRLPGGKGFGQRDATAAKNHTKRRAQALFPYVAKITHATADALLLAEFCRRRRIGQ